MTKRLRAGMNTGPIQSAAPNACECHPAASAASAEAVAAASSPESASAFTCSESELARKQSTVRALGWVLVLNGFTMVAEVGVGLASGSVSLAADGWHMLGHTVALALSYFVMRHLYRAQKRVTHAALESVSAAAVDAQVAQSGLAKLVARERKIGVFNAALLVVVGAFTVYDAVHDFFHPHSGDFSVALLVACIGLAVNLAGSLALRDSHDRNNVAEHGIYLHIASDALMSVLAIFALCGAVFFGFAQLDPAVGVLGGIVILKWGASLLVRGVRDLREARA